MLWLFGSHTVAHWHRTISFCLHFLSKSNKLLGEHNSSIQFHSIWADNTHMNLNSLSNLGLYSAEISLSAASLWNIGFAKSMYTSQNITSANNFLSTPQSTLLSNNFFLLWGSCTTKNETLIYLGVNHEHIIIII